MGGEPLQGPVSSSATRREKLAMSAARMVVILRFTGASRLAWAR
jgi:hypothetical protein